MPARVPIYSLVWHIDQSPALHDLVILPLSRHIQFEQMGLDGVGDLQGMDVDGLRNKPVIFFQLVPPETLSRLSGARVIWIPMWDQAQGYNQEWWQRLPKSLRVVSFSNEISRQARVAGLPTLDLRYAITPAECEEAKWGGKRTLLYWNRVGLVGIDFLEKICKTLDIEVLFFRRRIDPLIPAWNDYALPTYLGKTLVREFSPEEVKTRQVYLNFLRQAQVFIAPRLSEGVGLSFIEALARGCAVFAHDAPTMNEYITHKQNGYLLPPYYQTKLNLVRRKAAQLARRAASGMKLTKSEFQPSITAWQNWAEIAGLDLPELGRNARQDQLEKHAAWQASISNYASFILDW